MSVLPSRQFYPASFIDSFHSSLSNFHGVPLLLSGYNYSCTPFTRRHYCSTPSSVTSYPTNKRDSSKTTSFIMKNNDKTFGSYNQTPFSSSVWLDKWKESYKRNPPKPPRPAVNVRNKDSTLNFGSSSGENVDAGVGGSTMDRILEKLKKIGYMDDENENGNNPERAIEKGSVEDIFYVEEGIIPDTRGGFSADSTMGVELLFGGKKEVQFPWEKPAAKVEEANNSVKPRSRTYMAELTLPESELRRLRHLTLKTMQKLKIGGAGVTQAVVDAIHEKWKAAEIVRIKVEGAPALNMKRVHEILERKTGGLVIWRSGTSVSLYRGVSYEVPSEELKKWTFKKKGTQHNVPLLPNQSVRNPAQDDSYDSKRSQNASFHKTNNEEENSGTSGELKYEDEIDKLLADLGPRYTDWPGGDPLPVDADLLLSVVPGYQPPFRLLPYGVRRTLGLKEATALRRVARTLLPHFALGRSRQLEGLAAAIVQLWERSVIAKVALKRGVQLTTSERMAEDIKRLTGGILLSRNKDFLVFYRGKDFLSSEVTEALLERERLAKALQDEEEQARMKASVSVISGADMKQHHGAAGTLSETLDANAKWGNDLDDDVKEKMLRQAELMRHAKLVRKLEKKLVSAERKLMKAEYALAKVEAFLKPADRQPDADSITDEERFMFRKLGLKMKAFLLLGRRGVFDGTIENMHLHWKYRELVKITVKAKNFEDVKRIALSLEAESGGVLVSVDKVSKGFAIIVFRGKDYQRPSTLRPKNLLTKRKALARSIELQRREALLKHIAQMQKNVEKLRSEIEQVDMIQDQRDEELYARLDAAYPSEDEDTEEEGNEAYLETYDGERDEDESKSCIQSSHSETNFAYGLQYQETDAELAEVEEVVDDANVSKYAL